MQHIELQNSFQFFSLSHAKWFKSHCQKINNTEIKCTKTIEKKFGDPISLYKKTTTYVGEGKILANVLKGDVTFHAHRALQELHYDTLKSCKAIAITLPPSLLMPVPNDYVNYTKIAWVDDAGIERIFI